MQIGYFGEQTQECLLGSTHGVSTSGWEASQQDWQRKSELDGQPQASPRGAWPQWPVRGAPCWIRMVGLLTPTLIQSLNVDALRRA